MITSEELKKRGKKIYKIKRDDQLAVLAVPVRQMILDFVAASNRACSIKEIALVLDRKPDSLYFHIAKLVDTELLIKAGTESVMGKEVQLYATPEARMTIEYDLASDLFKERIVKIAGSILRLVERGFKAGLNSPKSKYEGAERNLFVSRVDGYVSPGQIKQINGHVESIFEILAQESTDKTDERISVTVAVTPFD